ncbi:tRNA pseudouridine synthase D, partial [mine drainage metagenome]
GRPGELLGALLAAEAVDPAGFRTPALPEVASRGAARPIVVPLPPLGLTAEPPDAVRFRFALPKGSYATVLLREFLKAPAA